MLKTKTVFWMNVVGSMFMVSIIIVGIPEWYHYAFLGANLFFAVLMWEWMKRGIE